jgi:hypothetical protein
LINLESEDRGESRAERRGSRSAKDGESSRRAKRNNSEGKEKSRHKEEKKEAEPAIQQPQYVPIPSNTNAITTTTAANTSNTTNNNVPLDKSIKDIISSDETKEKLSMNIMIPSQTLLNLTKIKTNIYIEMENQYGLVIDKKTEVIILAN